MFRARSAAIVAGVVATVAFAAGCGSSEQQVSATELTQRADAVCRNEQTKFEQIQAHPPANAQIASDQIKELIDAAQAASSDLRDLAPPDRLRAPYDAYLQARDDAVEQMNRGHDAADNGDSPGYSAAQSAAARSAHRRQQLAAAAGLKVCGASPRPG